MPQSLTILIVDKGGSIKPLTVKDYKVDELYKKCGFKKPDGLELRTEWAVKMESQKYIVQLYAKLDGKANMENKYDFPPPVDNQLYFGSCALVGLDANTRNPVSLTVELWEKIYEKLFGGFENLAVTCTEDDNEEDELENIPKHMKTKHGGYLKDGFVVDSSDQEEDNISGSSEEDGSDSQTNTSENENVEDTENSLEDIGSELSEEEYTYTKK
jgi:hypothetical protein